MHVSDKWAVLKLILFNFFQVYELIYTTRAANFREN